MAIFHYKLIQRASDRFVWAALIIGVFAYYFFTATNGGHPGDINFWTTWTTFLIDNPLGNIYQISCDYMPLYLYVLKIFSWLPGTPQDIGANIKFLKLFTLVFDMGIALILSGFVRHRHYQKIVFIALMMVLPFTYNSMVWAQVDAIFCFFSLAAVVLAIREKYIWTLPLLTLALNAKLQALLIVPILLGLVLLSLIKNSKKTGWSVGLGIVISLFLQLVLLLPFMIRGNLGQLWAAVMNPFQQETTVSFAAANAWFILTNSGLYDIARYTTDTTFWNLSLKLWGYILFFLSLVPMAIWVLKKRLSLLKASPSALFAPVLLITGLFALLCFFFCTGMHERYSHWAVVVLLGYGLLEGKWLMSVLLLLIYTLNMEAILHHYAWITSFTALTDMRVLAIGFFILICYFYRRLLCNTFREG